MDVSPVKLSMGTSQILLPAINPLSGGSLPRSMLSIDARVVAPTLKALSGLGSGTLVL